MRINQLYPTVRAEVEKPFPDKLQRAKTLIKLWGRKDMDGCISCSFGKDSMIVLWLALQEYAEIPVIFNNTGIQWKETYQFKEKIKSLWNLNLLELKPVLNYWQVMNRIKEKGLRGNDGSKIGSDLCCDYLKEKPFRRAVKENGFRYCLTGITAIESRQRMFTACRLGQEYYSKKDGVWKVHPIMYWTEEEVWNFIRENNIPVNPAYEKYHVTRLGCMFCVSHKGWRKQMARINPATYQFIQERYFNQKLIVPAKDRGEYDAKRKDEIDLDRSAIHGRIILKEKEKASV